MEDTSIYMDRILQELDFNSLDCFVKENVNVKMTFKELFMEILKNGAHGDLDVKLLQFLSDFFFYEVKEAKTIFVSMLLCAVLFSVLTHFFGTKKNYASDFGFLLIYSLMMLWLLKSLFVISDVVIKGVQLACTFFTLLIPTYSMILLVIGNAATAGGFYELAFGVICALEWLIKILFLPGVQFYVILGLLDHFFEEEHFSKLTDLIKNAIELFLKLMFSAVIGFGTVRQMLAVGQDHITKSVMLKSFSVLPGLGNGVRFAEDVIFSCGVLVKNCVGITGLLILFLLCVTPILKTFVYLFLYRLLAAILQPFSDKRIVNGIERVGNGCRLYLKIIIDTMLLFMITIALLTFSVN